MDEPEEHRVRGGRRIGAAAIIPLIGVAIMLGGTIAALLGGGDIAWVIAFLGLAVTLTAWGF